MFLEFIKRFTYNLFPPGTLIRDKYEAFKRILNNNLISHNILSEFEDFYYNKRRVEFSYIKAKYEELYNAINEMIKDLSILSHKYVNIIDYFKKIDFYIRMNFIDENYNFSPPFVLTVNNINSSNINIIGGKAKNLFLLKTKSLNVPNFFVITNNAYYYFYEYNNLKTRIEEILLRLDDIHNIDLLNSISNEIRSLILESEVPKAIIDEIYRSYEEIWKQSDVNLILRSSAELEDTNISFAGQYLSIANVKLDNIPTIYKEILASKYTPNAIFYRVYHGFKDIQLPMAVIVQELIQPKLGGVIYTNLNNNIILEYSNYSIENLVSGKITPNKVIYPRNDFINSQELQNKHFSKINKLIDVSLQIEEYFKSPQDIEWCIDNKENLFILQSRPLTSENPNQEYLENSTFSFNENDILIKDQGIVASSGVATGRLFILKNDNKLNEIPDGSILVTKYAKPEYALVMTRIRGIISEFGSTTGHLASIAREFNIPMLTSIENATKILSEQSNETVTLWADKKILTKGNIIPPIKNRLNKSDYLYTKSPVFIKLKEIVKHICPLRLINPESDDFVVENCKTLHDIIRFIHEKTINSIFTLGLSFNSNKNTKKLKTNYPISFLILDLGGGLREDTHKKNEINLSDIASIHFSELLKGILETLNPKEKRYLFDWKTMSEMVEAGGITHKDNKDLSSYAIISSDYMNTHIRFGYHFVIIDSIVSDNIEHNYITFRFTGGGGTIDGRILRANLISQILEKFNFSTSTKGDTVDASIKKINKNDILKNLYLLGQLLGFTTQLDLKLSNQNDIEKFLKEFYNKITQYPTSSLT